MAQMTRKEGRRHAGTTWCSAINCTNNKRRIENMNFFRFPKNPIR
jgi:hypothetical protein